MMTIASKFGASVAGLVVLCITIAGVAAAEDNARGEVLFELCAQCHKADASGNEETGAPAIAGMAEWYVEAQLEKFRDGLRGRHFDDIAGMRMRPMALTLRGEGDIPAVAAYVAGLPPTQPEPSLTGGDPTKGEALYAPCIACHGATGDGNQALYGAPLTHVSDWYLLRQLVNFRLGVRGTAPGDSWGAMMRPMALTLTDEQAMKDVIAYIMTLAK